MTYERPTRYDTLMDDSGRFYNVSVTTMSLSLVRTQEEPKGDESVQNSSLQAC